jgi:hypothetical protein
VFNSTEKYSKKALVKASCFLVKAITLSFPESTKSLEIAALDLSNLEVKH